MEFVGRNRMTWIDSTAIVRHLNEAWIIKVDIYRIGVIDQLGVKVNDETLGQTGILVRVFW